MFVLLISRLVAVGMLVEDHTKERKHDKLKGLLGDYIQIHITPATWKKYELEDATVITNHKFFVFGTKWKELCFNYKDVCKSSVSGKEIAYFEVKYTCS